MSEDLQSLLDKINRDGVEKAKAEAQSILAQAKEEAAKIVREAKEEAEKAKEQAAKSAEESVRRSNETIGQAARDTIKVVEGAVTNLLTGILANNVDKALGDEKTLAAIVQGAVKEFSTSGDLTVATSAGLVSALKAALASSAAKGVEVVLDPAIGSGFSVRLDGGRVEHSFTGAAVGEALARRLRSDLAKMVR